MGPRRRSKGKVDREAEEEEEREGRSVVVLSSTDDEEANKDLSLEIVEKARKRKGKRRVPAEDDVAARAPLVDLLSSASDAGVDDRDDGELVVAEEEREEKKKKRRKRSKKSLEVAGEDGAPHAEMLVKGEDPLGLAESVLTEVNGASDLAILPELVNQLGKDGNLLGTEDLSINEPSDNAILRKLLRVPRYFDPGDSTWRGNCYNCGEEGHAAANCTKEKRQKPCFVCGMFGHNSYQCTKGQDCYICRRIGHIAKDCPDKHQRSSQDSKICLRCGDVGHEMLTCSNDYAPDDIKEIQCYICRKFGHLCCVDFKDGGSGEVFCYICAQSGHTGVGCAKQSTNDIDTPPTFCYKCGEEGHFARGCINFAKSDRSDMSRGFRTPTKKNYFGESSTSSWRFASGGSSKRTKKFVEDNKVGFQSLPHHASKTHKKQRVQNDGKWSGTPRMSRPRGGWIVDDPGDMPTGKYKGNGWVSPSTYTERYPSTYTERYPSTYTERYPSTYTERYNKFQSTPSSGHYSCSWSPPRKHKFFSNSQSSANWHGPSGFRHGRSQGHYGRY